MRDYEEKNLSEIEAAVIGGGLAGLLATIRLTQAQVPTLLIDESLPDAKGALGGFARFSGAKFSLPPAGMGLVRLVGEQRFKTALKQVTAFLGLNIDSAARSSTSCTSKDRRISGNLFYRPYQSILLSSEEMNCLIEQCSNFLDKSIVIRGKCVRIDHNDGKWLTSVCKTPNNKSMCVKSRALFCASGRTGGGLLTQLGLASRDIKGIDLGVRVEVPDRSPLAQMRKLGPDAKLIYKKCRTFCFNFPGLMYRYPFNNVSVAGGIVAEGSCNTANVGLVFRAKDKQTKLHRLLKVAHELGNAAMESTYESKDGGMGNASQLVARLFGEEISRELQEFKSALGATGLADCGARHLIHLPLLDWYWPVFGGDKGFATDLMGLYVAGDVAGHARGLLQAALSGWLAAEEYLS